MEIGQRVDHGFAQSPADIGMSGQRQRLVPAHDDAASTLHDVEHATQHGLVLAQKIRARRERKHRMECGEPAELAGHVVRARRDRTERRTPHDHLGVRRTEPGMSGSSGRRETARAPSRSRGGGREYRRRRGAIEDRRRARASRAPRRVVPRACHRARRQSIDEHQRDQGSGIRGIRLSCGPIKPVMEKPDAQSPKPS